MQGRLSALMLRQQRDCPLSGFGGEWGLGRNGIVDLQIIRSAIVCRFQDRLQIELRVRIFVF